MLPPNRKIIFRNSMHFFIMASLIAGLALVGLPHTQAEAKQTTTSPIPIQNQSSTRPITQALNHGTGVEESNLETRGFSQTYTTSPRPSIERPGTQSAGMDPALLGLTQSTVQGSSPWQQLNQDGFGDNNFQIPAVQEFNGYLYAGTWKNVDEVISAEVWRTDDGYEWWKVDEGMHNGCADMVVFDTYLYCGSWDGVIWRTADGTTWQEIVSDGFGDANNGIARFVVYNGMLYAGTWNGTTGTQIWRTSNGTFWEIFGNGLDPNNIVMGAISTELFDGYLYWGTGNWETGAQLWRTDGTTLWEVPISGLDSPAISSLAAFGGYLYAGVWDDISTQVWRSADGIDWTQLLTFSNLGSDIREANGLEVYDGMLYLVGTNYDSGLEVWRTGNGTDWEQVGFVGFGDSSNGMSFWDNAITTFEGKLIISTNNFNSGGEVWAYAPNDYEVYDVNMWLNLGVSDWIWGHAVPGSDVTIVTPRDTINAYADPACNGCWGLYEPIEINPGDLITVTADAGLYPVDFTLPTPLVSHADSVSDQVWGQIGGWDTQTVAIHGWWEDGDQEVTTDASGNFSATYTDIPRGGDGYIHFATVEEAADINYHQYFRTPDLIMEIRPDHNLIEGQYAPGHTIGLILTDSSDVYKAQAILETTEIEGWDGRTGFATWINDECWDPSPPDIVPGDKIYGSVDSDTYLGYIQVGNITGDVDVDTDSISGSIDAPWLIPNPGVVNVECYGWGAPAGAPDKYDIIIPDGIDPYNCAWDPDNEWDVEPNQTIGAAYRDPEGHKVTQEFIEYDYNLYLNVNYGHDWIEFWYPPDFSGTLTVTESDGETVKATVDFTTAVVPWWGGDTGFSTNMDGVVWDPERPDIQSGDWVFGEVDVEGTIYSAQVQLGDISGEIDIESDTIIGTINAPWLPQDVEVEVWCQPYDGAPPETGGKSDSVLPNGEDPYTCAWDPDTEWDIQPNHAIGVYYGDPGNHWIVNVFTAYTDELILQIHFDHNWINGSYEPGHEVFLQVVDSGGLEKAHITLPTGYLPGWGSTSGFDTGMEGAEWIPSQPDIEPGDVIHGEVDDGSQFTADVEIGVLTGFADVALDTVTGTVDASWLMPGPVQIGCYIWENNAPENKYDEVTPDGADTFECSWAGEWDLVPGSNLMVAYFEPDGHQIVGDFSPPAPHLRIEKWLEGGGSPGVGGNATFYVQYANLGSDTAEDVVIADTLVGMTYLSDTSGITPSGGGTIVSWALGNVEPGDWIGFYVFAQVTASTGGEPISNQAVITTSDPFDMGEAWEKIGYWEGTAAENDTYLNIGINPWTWNPAVGQSYVYAYNVCNNGSTGSSAVTMTVNLPTNTDFEIWWGREAGWEEISQSGHTLVVEHLSIPAWQCYEVYARVEVDPAAEPEDELFSSALIYANNDLSEDDNYAEVRHNVGWPWVDLGISANWHWGTLVAGGYYRYGIGFKNEGNVGISEPIEVTTTLPEGTSFAGWDHWDWASVGEPTMVDNQITWLVDGLDAGYYGTIEVFVDINSDTLPGSLLEHTVAIEIQPDETYTENNFGGFEEMVFEHGPNLRIRKWGDWHGHGEGHNAWYQLQVENIGDQTIEDVVITDHYPIAMELDGDAGVGFWEWWDFQDFPDDHYFTISLERLEPGWNVGINFNVVIPGDDPVPFGLVFTNTAEVTLDPEDANPADNSAEYLLGSGPDMFVDKTLGEGEFHPGEEVSYLLTFGNKQPGHTWWWNMAGNAMVMDTLPVGMSFVSSYWHCYSDEYEWCEITPIIDGQELTWEMWPMGAGEWHEIWLTVLIDEGVADGTGLVNNAEIFSNAPTTALDPFPDNNFSSYAALVEVPLSFIYLPLILK